MFKIYNMGLAILTLMMPTIKKMVADINQLLITPITNKFRPGDNITEDEKIINWKIFFVSLIKYISMLALMFLIWKLVLRFFPFIGKAKGKTD